MSQIKQCYLHIGAAKTGTTSIQGFFVKNRELLLQEGYHVAHLGTPNPSHLFMLAYGLDGHGIDDWHYQNMLDFFDAEPGKLREKIKQAFQDELQALPSVPHTLIVSNEHLKSALKTPEMIQPIYDLLSEFCEHIQVIIYLRRQDLTAVSMLTTQAMGGHLFPHIMSNRETQAYRHDYRQILQNYGAVFGKENILVRIFERDKLVKGDAIHDFLHVVGLRNLEQYTFPGTLNTSLQAPAQHFLFELNKYIPRRQLPLAWRIRQSLRVHYNGRGMRPSRDRAQTFQASFEEINQWVADAYFPSQEGPLFSDDFSQYPEKAELDSPSFEEAAEIAASILKHIDENKDNPLPQRLFYKQQQIQALQQELEETERKLQQQIQQLQYQYDELRQHWQTLHATRAMRWVTRFWSIKAKIRQWLFNKNPSIENSR